MIFRAAGGGGVSSWQLALKLASVYQYLQASSFGAFCDTSSLGHFYPVTVVPAVCIAVLSSGPTLRLVIATFLQYENKFPRHRNTWWGKVVLSKMIR